MKNDKLFVWLLVLCVVSVISIATVTVNKQNTERELEQQKLDIQKAELQYKKEQAQKAENDEYWNKQLLDACIRDADVAYWSYMELNGTPQDDGSIYALTRYWDTAKRDKQDYIDNCYRKYNK